VRWLYPLRFMSAHRIGATRLEGQTASGGSRAVAAPDPPTSGLGARADGGIGRRSGMIRCVFVSAGCASDQRQVTGCRPRGGAARGTCRGIGRSGQERRAQKAAAAASGVAAAYVWAGGGVAVRPRRPLGRPPAPAQTCVRFGWRPHPWGRLVDRRPCPTLFAPMRPCVTAFLLWASLRPAPGSVNLGPSLANHPSRWPNPWAATAPVLNSVPYP
jgi:hypothetical protein